MIFFNSPQGYLLLLIYLGAFQLAFLTEASKPCNSHRDFKCHGNGDCIPKYNVCNEVADCADGSDEEFCLLGARSALGDIGVTHLIAEFRGAFRSFVRELMKEISNLLRLQKSSEGDDSLGREAIECNQEEAFYCKADGICISLSARCDTKHDCSDGEDERPRLCSIVEGSSLRRTSNKDPLIEDRVEKLVPLPEDLLSMEEKVHLPFLPRSKSKATPSHHSTTKALKVICNSKQFACDNTCIPLSWVCDDLEDCVDKTDEKQCKQT